MTPNAEMGELSGTINPDGGEQAYDVFDAGAVNPVGRDVLVQDGNCDTGKIPIATDDENSTGNPGATESFWCGSQ